jgi:hypothetical protein
MCIFSVASDDSVLGRLKPARMHVSSTNLFARMVAPGVQCLVYGMTIAAKQDVAMILPLPVRPGGGANAVRFVDLQAHRNIFRELAALFDVPEDPQRMRGLAATMGALRPKLEVHKVGAFIASYVATRADFDRLDPRFRVPEVVFDTVPAYDTYGFAVFQLAPGESTVHPMAFTFPTRDVDRLFFPCVHLHDGTWQAAAKFDHALYYQHPKVVTLGDTNEGDACSTVLPARDYAKLVNTAHPMLRRELRNRQPNADIWIATGRPASLFDT